MKTLDIVLEGTLWDSHLHFCLTFQFSTKSAIRHSSFPSQILNTIKVASRSFLELNCKCRWVKFQTETRNHESRRMFAHIFWTSDVLLDLLKNSLNARKNISENRNINLIIPHLKLKSYTKQYVSHEACRYFPLSLCTLNEARYQGKSMLVEVVNCSRLVGIVLSHSERAE